MKSRFLMKEICAEKKGSRESMKCLMRGVLTTGSDKRVEIVVWILVLCIIVEFTQG